MAQLLAWCDAGACGIAPVTGDAGIGKTWTSIVGRDGDAGFGQWRWLHEIAVPGRGDPLDGAVLVLVHVPAPHALQPVVRAALRAEVGVAGGPGVVLGGAWCRSREMPPERGSVTCRRQVLDGSAASSRACDLTGPVGERDRRLPGTVMFPGDGSSAGLVQITAGVRPGRTWSRSCVTSGCPSTGHTPASTLVHPWSSASEGGRSCSWSLCAWARATGVDAAAGVTARVVRSMTYTARSRRTPGRPGSDHQRLVVRSRSTAHRRLNPSRRASGPAPRPRAGRSGPG